MIMIIIITTIVEGDVLGLALWFVHLFQMCALLNE